MNFRYKNKKKYFSTRSIIILSILSFVFLSFTEKSLAQLGDSSVPIEIKTVTEDGMKEYFGSSDSGGLGDLGGLGSSLGLGNLTGGNNGDNTNDTSKALTVMRQQKKYQISDAPSLEKAFQSQASELVNKITQRTVEWVAEGFNKGNGGSGNSAYISDLTKFLANSADEVVGDFIQNDPDLKFLCQPFQSQVKKAILKTYSNSSPQNSKTFQNKIKCTASNAIENLSKEFNWSDWMKINSEPQNNPLGAYIIAQNQLQEKIDTKQTEIKTEVQTGNGALTYQSCTDKIYEIDSKTGEKGTEPIKTFGPYTGSKFYGNQDTIKYMNEQAEKNKDKKLKKETECTTKTPGSVITDMLGFNANSQQRQSELKANVSSGNLAYDSQQSLLGNLLSSALDGVISSLFNNVIKLANDTLNEGILSSKNEKSYNDLNQTYQNLSRDAQDQYQNYSDNGNGNSSGNSSVSNSIISALQRKIQDETGYQTIIKEAINILNLAKSTFGSARTCNATAYQDTGASARGFLIQTNILDNIDGIKETRDLPDIKWNLPYLQSLLSISEQHVNLLNSMINIVTASSTGWASTTEAQQIASTTFNKPSDLPKDNRITSLTSIQNIPTDTRSGLVAWFEKAASMYTSRSCPLNSDSIENAQITKIEDTKAPPTPTQNISTTNTITPEQALSICQSLSNWPKYASGIMGSAYYLKFKSCMARYGYPVQ